MAAFPIATVLLPGLDGTGRLFDPLLAVLAGGVTPQVLRYPSERAMGYGALEAEIAAELPPGPFAIIAESFAGPLALRLASRRPPGLVALVLVATFVSSPVTGALSSTARALLRPWLPAVRIPAFAARRWLLGEGASDELVAWFASNLLEVATAVVASRVRDVLDVDATAALRGCTVPILYVTGTQDRLVSTRSGDEIRTLRPDVEHASVDAPHLVLQVAPAAAAQVIAAFLDRAVASGETRETCPR
jgi:pimeloyl-[acyl-carrier protein] methyl ester esterase